MPWDLIDRWRDEDDTERRRKNRRRFFSKAAVNRMPPTEFAEMPYLYLQAGYEIDLVTGEPVARMKDGI